MKNKYRNSICPTHLLSLFPIPNTTISMPSTSKNKKIVLFNTIFHSLKSRLNSSTSDKPSYLPLDKSISKNNNRKINTKNMFQSTTSILLSIVFATSRFPTNKN